MQLVYIEWIDSHSPADSWMLVGDLKDLCGKTICRSVGWLLAERDDHKIIAPHLSGGAHSSTASWGKGALIIPNVAIRKIKVLSKSL